MTDKEFKKLSRADLISIIFEMQKNEQKLKEELENTKAALESKEIKIEEAGSIAEATVGLNELFERAQKSADEYLEKIRESKERQDRLLEDTEKEAAEIKAKAQQEADSMIETAEKTVADKWQEFNRNMDSMLSGLQELKERKEQFEK